MQWCIAGQDDHYLSPMNLCEQAETFRLLLIMGIASRSEIVAWADAVIAAQAHLPEWLLDVSLAANEDDYAMESRLRALPCDANRRMAAYSAIDRFAEEFRSGGIPPNAGARMLEKWAASAKVNQDDWTAAMIPLWVADEVEHGYTSDED
ncbi:MAG: hypothetical protein M3478_14755, partial [Planctomycetota bacterium]|nr:hypothetical protein [Planctomycetota bacterium]